MNAIEKYRKLALSFNAVTEEPHFDKASFRVKKKIFCTLDANKNRASLKLSPVDQSVYCTIDPTIIFPATGAWGKQGWTVVDLIKVKKNILAEAIGKAYQEVSGNAAPAVPKKKAKPEQIQTLHPDKTKTNKLIALDKYNVIKEQLLAILQKQELTHTDLMECLYQNVKDSFEGGVQWYGETVKLDLEARQLIERTTSKPEKYRMKIIL